MGSNQPDSGLDVIGECGLYGPLSGQGYNAGLVTTVTIAQPDGAVSDGDQSTFGKLCVVPSKY